MVPDGGDVGIVVRSGVSSNALDQGSPLCDGAKGVVMSGPLSDGVKFLSVFLCLEGDGDVIGCK